MVYSNGIQPQLHKTNPVEALASGFHVGKYTYKDSSARGKHNTDTFKSQTGQEILQIFTVSPLSHSRRIPEGNVRITI
jgi:hypothetical protein